MGTWVLINETWYKFIDFAVDMFGTPEARYDPIADEAEAAAQEAWQYLKRHRIIEV